jgi:hypothetical protein
MTPEPSKRRATPLAAVRGFRAVVATRIWRHAPTPASETWRAAPFRYDVAPPPNTRRCSSPLRFS